MLQVRHSESRGKGSHGWLESRHSFSFSEYYDPNFMGFGSVRVINEDWVQPQTGFGTHGHRDMEIITYMLDGELSHRDSLGGGSTIARGQIQRMSAGAGIRHSEMNLHRSEVAHLLQIWIEPAQRGVAPSYKDHNLDLSTVTGRLGLIVTGDEVEAERLNIAYIHQNAKLYAGHLQAQTVEFPLASGRKGYVHVAKGELVVNGEALVAGDALMAQDEALLTLVVKEKAEVLVFDLF